MKNNPSSSHQSLFGTKEHPLRQEAFATVRLLLSDGDPDKRAVFTLGYIAGMTHAGVLSQEDGEKLMKKI